MLHSFTQELPVLPRVFLPDQPCGSEQPDEESDLPPSRGTTKPKTQPDSTAKRKREIKPPMGTDRLERPAFIPIDSEQQDESS